MTISAVLTATALEIVDKAYGILSATDAVIPLSSEDRELGFTSLNFMVSTLQTNYHLWTETRAIIPLESGKVEYKLGPSGDHAANKDDFKKLVTDAISTGNTLSVTGNINIGDNIGIIHTDLSIQWTTVTAYVTGTATLADNLTLQTTTSSTVYVYTNKLERPMKVVNSRYQSSISGRILPTSKWNATQYDELGDELDSGSVVAWYYSPQITNGLLSVYKKPSNNAALLNITYVRPINITSANGDKVDFPREWFLPLSYMLAQQMIPEVDTPDQDTETIDKLAEKYAAMVGVVPLGKLKPMPEAGP